MHSTFPQVEKLFDAFRHGPGVFGKTREDMPEHFYLRRVPPEDRVNVLTIAAAMDYQTNAGRLWQAAKKTNRDPQTRWLFDMAQVARRNVENVFEAMSDHHFTGRYPNKNASYVWRLCRTFGERYGGSPLGLLKEYDHDALRIYRSGKRLGDLPGLTGRKILPFWLRILKDEAGIDLKNIQHVPMPVDVHVARATLRIIYHSNQRPDVPAQREEMIQKWFEICRSIDRPEIYPLALDQPLWLLSRHGCSGTDGKERCPRAAECVVAEFCVFRQG